MQNTNLMDLDSMFAPSARTALKGAAPGTSIEGEIVHREARQATEYGTGLPAVFPDGTPKKQIMVVIKTNERDPLDPNDDGERSVWIKNWGNQRKAFTAAMQAAGVKKTSEALAPGNRLKITYVGETRQTSSKGSWTEKTYEYAITLQQVAAVDNAFAPQQATTPTPQPVQAAPQTVPQNPAPTATQPEATDSLGRAYQLIGLGVSNEDIAKLTGMNADQVEALRTQAPF